MPSTTQLQTALKGKGWRAWLMRGEQRQQRQALGCIAMMQQWRACSSVIGCNGDVHAVMMQQWRACCSVIGCNGDVHAVMMQQWRACSSVIGCSNDVHAASVRAW
eukprot:1147486-Pelagomonas_calceolata.AAC.6